MGEKLPVLWTPTEFSEMLHRRTKIAVFSLGVAAVNVTIVCSSLIWLQEMGWPRLGVDPMGAVAHTAKVGGFVAAFVFFLVPLWIGETIADGVAVCCPHCGCDFQRSVTRLQKTKRCRQCGSQVLAGRVHSDRAFDRYRNRRTVQFVAWWLWSWPGLQILITLGTLLECGLSTGNGLGVFTPATLGFILSTWTWVRTRDRRVLATLIANIVALMATAILLT